MRVAHRIRRWTLRPGLRQADRLYVNVGMFAVLSGGGSAEVDVAEDGVIFIRATEGTVRVAAIGESDGVAC